MTNNKRPIREPEDLAGLKIRVVGSPIFVETFRALGVNPVDINFAELLRPLPGGLSKARRITLWHYAIAPWSSPSRS